MKKSKPTHLVIAISRATFLSAGRTVHDSVDLRYDLIVFARVWLLHPVEFSPVTGELSEVRRVLETHDGED